MAHYRPSRLWILGLTASSRPTVELTLRGERDERENGSKAQNDLVEDDDESHVVTGKGFFASYILTFLSSRHKGHTYIVFTVNPKRRIRQHNGEIRSGTYRTKKKRPWEMFLGIYGLCPSGPFLHLRYPKASNFKIIFTNSWLKLVAFLTSLWPLIQLPLLQYQFERGNR